MDAFPPSASDLRPSASPRSPVVHTMHALLARFAGAREATAFGARPFPDAVASLLWPWAQVSPSSPTWRQREGLDRGHQLHTSLQGSLLSQWTCKPSCSWWDNWWFSSSGGLTARHPAIHSLTHQSPLPHTQVWLQTKGLWHSYHLLPGLFLALLPRTSGLSAPLRSTSTNSVQASETAEVDSQGMVLPWNLSSLAPSWRVPDHADRPLLLLASP